MRIKDIAREAGVSPSTVSLVLSNKGRISEEVRERVTRIAQSLGYERPQRVTRKPGRVDLRAGILLEIDPEWEFAWRVSRTILSSLIQTLETHDYKTVLIPIDLKKSPNELEAEVRRADVSALFSLHYANKELFLSLESEGIPVIILNNSTYQEAFYSVCVDDFQGAYDGGLQLIRRGHRHIAYVDFERPDMPALVSDRFVGFRKAADEHDIEFTPAHRITTDLSNMDDLPRKLEQLLAEPRRPTAIFAHDDYLAVNIVAVLNRLGYSVPKDISLIAHGDCMNYAHAFVPKISTLRINSELLGDSAAELMIKRLQGNEDALHVLKVNQRFIDRGSCRTIK